MVSLKDLNPKTETKLVPPDGGWGHLITASVTVMSLVSIVPQTSFGLIFGKFLASIGDETTGTTIVNGVFNTVQSFTGLATGFLLQKYSYRKVGLLGAVLFFLGAFAIIFITNLAQMIITFGVLQGLGYGLMVPASFSAFNTYFSKKMNLMMGIAQAVMVLAAIVFPPVTAVLMEYCGFRGTITALAVLSLLNFPAMGVLQPVKWHMKRVPVEDVVIKDPEMQLEFKSKSLNEEVLRKQIQPLLSKESEVAEDESKSSLTPRGKTASKPRFSVVSLGDRAMSVISDTEVEEKLRSFSKYLDLSLLKDVKYLNISIGVSLSFTSDVAFISIIPLILINAGFSVADVALMMMVYFGADLVSRILLSAISAVCQVRNRYVFMAGSLLSAVFRIAFVMRDAYVWKMVTLAALGFLRCLIQTPLSLVFAEEYKENFPTAFSLYMAVCGFISILVGLLASAVKSFTQSDIMVVHVLTGAFLISGISWVVELGWSKLTARKIL
ncbi:hypothetical protein NQ315_009608 [Exocentrus adspersus]|uniref:Monocarboxylate transporter n=1 Tax=Exocentrus adspersus TaxID=1586481 RepID=A0AAV8WHZ8_9CUCU|nr:hypothetical protein NQ315_009608 [Exocentrus adspersus]